MKDQASVLRETDDEARRQARVLLRSARYGALAVLDPETGFPSASRVLLGTDIDAVPVILVSGLSAHTRALTADPRSSLLVGEPGKGDPLAYPRLSVQCLAERIDRQASHHAHLRTRFLDRHAKAKLYVDFPDFCFFRLVPQSAGLNGGFARAYVLPGSDLAIRAPLAEAFARQASKAVRELVGLHPGIADDLAAKISGRSEAGWRVCGLDPAGLDLVSGDNLLRFEFDDPLPEEAHIISHISKIAYSIP
ncbi:pyridoxamine 5'-phosphate oxidase family protein [Rhizobium sp. BK251]|uniref:HugZ family pyridoxamine 5'-phosphate oxidase n=1 Tax=Rhizobium sp. BK251 TaxID=2512125 RepID=UPI00104CE124|nr:pyridoxamine 5'-phosphate oxidase family protein [Rhizobium sp. BK251]TCL74696.1 hypothetical protein EV286_102257 [Rhizobium sp. BK251]